MATTTVVPSTSATTVAPSTSTSLVTRKRQHDENDDNNTQPPILNAVDESSFLAAIKTARLEELRTAAESLDIPTTNASGRRRGRLNKQDLIVRLTENAQKFRDFIATRDKENLPPNANATTLTIEAGKIIALHTEEFARFKAATTNLSAEDQIALSFLAIKQAEVAKEHRTSIQVILVTPIVPSFLPFIIYITLRIARLGAAMQ